MTTGQTFIRHLFEGGWDVSQGPTVDVVPESSGIVRVPYLLDADNCIYEQDGGPRKAPGTSRVNSSALESGAVVKGLHDYWIQGTSGSPTQKRVIHVGTTIKKDDADGTFTNIFTGMESGAVPAYSTFDDILIISSDSTVDVPKSWDGTTAQNLAGSPPNFSFSATHKNRSWAAGNAANPSALYYCALLDPEDWTGSGSGSISIDPDDGDRITGIISHKNELWVFKGPYKGSIHRITGSAPTGTDAFARNTFIRGVGAVGHNSIFRFRDDIGFIWSDGSIRSLKATDAFGDFNEIALSRPINPYIREHFNASRMAHAWASTCDTFGVVLITMPINSSTNNNLILMMDYRFDPVRWAPWPSFAMGCIADVVDSNAPACWAGTNDGYVVKLFHPTRSIAGGTTISYKMTTPHLTYGHPGMLKMMNGGSLGIQPKNNGNITFGWTRDDNAQQTTTIAQGGTAVLGPASANQFTLGTSALGGARFVDRFFVSETGGEFRSVQFQVTNNVDNEDVEIHSLSAIVNEAGWSMENN